MRPILLITVVVILLFPTLTFSRKIPLPQDLGRVRLNNSSRQAGMAPVVFDHWLHRAKFTCRLCHVDIGFAMEGEATGISADLNMQGYYCGACHDGQRVIDGQDVFAACAAESSEKEAKRCVRCHSEGKKIKKRYTFDAFTADLPRMNVGNLIDWEQAEAQGKIRPIDFLKGVSVARDKLQARKDFSIEVTTWASDVIFSHKKHAVWNGCELCHPGVFPSAEKGTLNYSMFQIMRGEFCGICHKTVAFPVWLCAKCHKNPARQF